MWRLLRLLPLLLGLGFIELLVPWPDVASLVLNDAGQVGLRDIPGGTPAPAALRLFTNRE